MKILELVGAYKCENSLYICSSLCSWCLLHEFVKLLFQFSCLQLHVITFHLVHGLSVSLPLKFGIPPSSHQAITITLHFQTSSKDTLLPVSLSCHLASIHQRALILFIQTLALYKSFTYLLTYLHVVSTATLC